MSQYEQLAQHEFDRLVHDLARENAFGLRVEHAIVNTVGDRAALITLLEAFRDATRSKPPTRSQGRQLAQVPGAVAVAQLAFAVRLQDAERLLVSRGKTLAEHVFDHHDRALLIVLVLDDSDASADVLMPWLTATTHDYRLWFERFTKKWNPSGRLAARLAQPRGERAIEGARQWMFAAVAPGARLQLWVDLETEKQFVLWLRSPGRPTQRWSADDAGAKGGFPAIKIVDAFPHWFARVTALLGLTWESSLVKADVRGLRRAALLAWHTRGQSSPSHRRGGRSRAAKREA